MRWRKFLLVAGVSVVLRLCVVLVFVSDLFVVVFPQLSHLVLSAWFCRSGWQVFKFECVYRPSVCVTPRGPLSAWISFCFFSLDGVSVEALCCSEVFVMFV